MQIITFETAKLAKEKGFGLGQTPKYYQLNTRKLHSQKLLVKDITRAIPAPSQSQIQNWFIEEHSLLVTVRPYSYEAPGAVFFISEIVPLRGSNLRFDKRIEEFNTLQERQTWDEGGFNSSVRGTYNKVLEIGLNYALTLI